MSRPDYTVDGDCWLWQKSVNNSGYGLAKKNRRTVLAHRFYYERHVGPIPEGFQIDHLCRNKTCVNPAHMEPVTPAENTRRAPSTRLKADQVREIKGRLAGGESNRRLAAAFSVSAGTIADIRTGRNWAGVA